MKTGLNLPPLFLQSPWVPKGKLRGLRLPPQLLWSMQTGLAPPRSPGSWSNPQTDYSTGFAILQVSLCVAFILIPVPTLKQCSALLGISPRKNCTPLLWKPCRFHHRDEAFTTCMATSSRSVYVFLDLKLLALGLPFPISPRSFLPSSL